MKSPIPPIPPTPPIPLIERLRRVSELSFLNWETFDEELTKRLLISSLGVDRPRNQNAGLHKPGRYRSRYRKAGAGPISFSTFREFAAKSRT
ncbi:MAG: hypothetical protein ACREDR_11200 [Blastocatellia bacterium]